jgi:gluconolactonase
VTVVDRWDGKRFNSPNDLVFDSTGNLYFTDPPYGLPNQENDETREIPFFGVFKLAADGKLSVIDDGISRPNGIALSPDEKILYVTDTATGRILAFDVTDSGTVVNRRVFADMSGSDREGGADGIKIDIYGNVYSTGPGGVHVFSSEGTPLGLINTVERCANLAWGGDNGSVLYITADMYLMRVKTATSGSGL